jgi:oligoribonuclease (3'-5' exoribonuclease)
MSIVGLEQRIVKTGFDIKSFDEGISTDEPLIRRLHKTNTNLTWLDCTTNFELKLLQFSKDTIELYERIRKEKALAILPRKCRTIIEQEIISLMNSCSNRQYHGRGLQERTKVQISIVSDIESDYQKSHSD